MKTYASIEEAAEALYVELSAATGIPRADLERVVIEVFKEVCTEEAFIKDLLERICRRLIN